MTRSQSNSDLSTRLREEPPNEAISLEAAARIEELEFELLRWRRAARKFALPNAELPEPEAIAALFMSLRQRSLEQEIRLADAKKETPAEAGTKSE